MIDYKLMPLYRAGAYLSALSLVAICALISAQILCRLLDVLLSLVGLDTLGWSVPGLSEIAGFLLVGVSFMGLAYTFVEGGHIRVTLLISRLSPRWRVWVEMACLTLAVALTFYLAFFLARLVEDSWTFSEMSYGLLSAPLWIPQSVLTAGILLFALALLEAWWGTAKIALLRPQTYVADDHAQE